MPSSSCSPTVRSVVYLRLPGRGALSQRVLDPLMIHSRRERPTNVDVAKLNPDHLFACWVILGRLIEMKHLNPNCLGQVLLCRLGHPVQCGVVVNVPASPHGTVMSLPGEPVDVRHVGGSWSREVVGPAFP